MAYQASGETLPSVQYNNNNTRHVGPGVKGIIGMHRFNFCLVVVLLWCENTISCLGSTVCTVVAAILLVLSELYPVRQLQTRSITPASHLPVLTERQHKIMTILIKAACRKNILSAFSDDCVVLTIWMNGSQTISCRLSHFAPSLKNNVDFLPAGLTSKQTG